MSSVDVESRVEELRASWKFAAVSQFMCTFHSAFDLSHWDTEVFEDQLAKKDPEVTKTVYRLVSTLLKADKVESSVVETISRAYAEYAPDRKPWDTDNPPQFVELPLATQVDIIKNLTDWQFRYPERFRNKLQAQQSDAEWRVEPIGQDAKGSTYWLFDDNRLYKETAQQSSQKTGQRSKSKAKSRRSAATGGTGWETVAITAEDWETYPRRFAKSKNLAERDLYKMLTAGVPTVLDALRIKEKERKRTEALANRKKSERLLIKDIQRAEEARIAEEKRQREFEEEQRQAEQEKKELEEQMHQSRQREREKRYKERELRMQQRELEAQKVAEERAKRANRRHTVKEKDNRIGGRKSWVFDCVCGVRGNDYDDNTPMVSCDKCHIWQHIACLAKMPQYSEVNWDKVDFVCQRCAPFRSSTAKDMPSNGTQSLPTNASSAAIPSWALGNMETPKMIRPSPPRTLLPAPTYPLSPVSVRNVHVGADMTAYSLKAPKNPTFMNTVRSPLPPTNTVTYGPLPSMFGNEAGSLRNMALPSVRPLTMNAAASGVSANGPMSGMGANSIAYDVGPNGTMYGMRMNDTATHTMGMNSTIPGLGMFMASPHRVTTGPNTSHVTMNERTLPPIIPSPHAPANMGSGLPVPSPTTIRSNMNMPNAVTEGGLSKADGGANNGAHSIIMSPAGRNVGAVSGTGSPTVLPGIMGVGGGSNVPGVRSVIPSLGGTAYGPTPTSPPTTMTTMTHNGPETPVRNVAGERTFETSSRAPGAKEGHERAAQKLTSF